MLFFVLQLLMNIITGYLLYRVYCLKNSSSDSGSNAWKVQWEEEKKSLEEQFSVQLRSMRLLYEQTQKVLHEKQMELHQLFPPSMEETELQHLTSQHKTSPLFTIDQFEREKSEFNARCSLDLKSLLSEQLC